MADTLIPWCKKVWNPTTGCTPVSRGCDHCYAARWARRLQAMGAKGYENGFAVTLHPERLDDPLHWRKPCRIFVDSMGDLFHPAVCGWNAPGKWKDWGLLVEIAHIIRCTQQHSYIILTKRPHIMADLWPRALSKLNAPNPLPNVCLGVSVEDQPTADERIPILMKIPAAVRLVSLEPMLGPVELRRGDWAPACSRLAWLHGVAPFGGFAEERGLDWVICGGETGPGARPTHRDWVRKVRDDCAAAGVPFWFKSWGEWGYKNQGASLPPVTRTGRCVPRMISMGADARALRVGKKRAGRMLDGRTHDAAPEQETEDVRRTTPIRRTTPN